MYNKEKHDLNIVILCAGKSTRFRRTQSKVLAPLAGRAVILHVLDTAVKFRAKKITIVVDEQKRDEIFYAIKPFMQRHSNIMIVNQTKNMRGTAAALLSAQQISKSSDTKKTLVLYADVPMIDYKTIDKLINSQKELAIIAFHTDKPKNYGRLIMNNHKLMKIVEEKNLTSEQKNINLVNSGIICSNTDTLFNKLSKLKVDKNIGEKLLTDVICQYSDIEVIKGNKNNFIGINNCLQLSTVEKLWQDNKRKDLMQEGTIIIDPSSVFFSFDTVIGRDVTIYPNVFFDLGVKLQNNIIIYSYSHLSETHIKDGARIGPFTKIRANSTIGEKSEIASFVELKKVIVADKVKIKHLAYVGDSHIGSNSNIGAGVIFCNYDGFKKHRSIVGKNSFIGSNSSIISPIKIGDNAIIGAGTTVTKDVQSNDICVGRAPEVHVKAGATRYRRIKSGNNMKPCSTKNNSTENRNKKKEE